MALRVLFIGGNGIISSASSARVVGRGDELTLLNRGTSTTRPRIDGVRHSGGVLPSVDEIVARVQRAERGGERRAS